MKMPYRMEIVEDEEEGGFVVSYPDLPGCITCGETIESAEKELGLKQHQKKELRYMNQTAWEIILDSSN